MLTRHHLPEHVRNPSRKQLRQFAGLLPLAALLICWWWPVPGKWAILAVTVSMGAAIAGWLRPTILKPPFVTLSLIALPIGWVVGEFVLLIVYFGLITPIGVIFRLLHRDVLERRIDRQAATYWREKPQSPPPSSYLRRW